MPNPWDHGWKRTSGPTGAALRVRFARSNPRHTPRPMRHVKMGHQAILDGPLSLNGAGCSLRSIVRSQPCAEYNTSPAAVVNFVR